MPGFGISTPKIGRPRPTGIAFESDGAPGGNEGVKLEEQVLITETGVEILSWRPFDERLLS